MPAVGMKGEGRPKEVERELATKGEWAMVGRNVRGGGEVVSGEGG